MKRSLFATTFLLAAVGLCLLVACADEKAYTASILSRPVDFAVTCVSADRSFMPVVDCGKTDGLAVSWILDGDLDGVFVSTLPDGEHFDFDAVLPGYSPMPVRSDAVAIEPSPDSRYIFVASNGGVEQNPALTLIDGDFFSMVGAVSTVELPCPLTDMVVMDDPDAPAKYAIAALLSCPSGSQVWRLEPVAGDLRQADGPFVLMELLAEVPGRARWISTGQGRVMVVSAELPQPDYLHWDYLVVLDGLVPGATEVTAVPVVNDSLVVPRYRPEGLAAGCGNDSQPQSIAPGYVSGRPAVMPGGDFIYVPMAIPSGLAVFDRDLVRVDTHAPIPGLDITDTTIADQPWNIANMLAGWLGYRDIRMDSPVLGVTFVNTEDGLRALAWLYGGQLVRILTEASDTVPWPHRAENDLLEVESSAYMPVVTWQGAELERAILTRTDLPSFGGTQVVIPKTEDDKYVYYGITFNGDIEAEVPEVWSATYEGVIPGAEGGCGRLMYDSGDGWFRTWALQFTSYVGLCDLGVQAADESYVGDIVEINLPWDESCGELAGATVEFRVLRVSGGSMLLGPMTAAGGQISIPSGCEYKDVNWRVRASGQWVVSGSRTGFLHPWMTDSSFACVHRPGADPIFTGRAVTSMPVAGSVVVESCPIIRGQDVHIDWNSSRFRNPMFEFHIVPGCRLDSNYHPVVIPPVRDTIISFAMETGRLPFQNDIGGLPTGVVVAGDTLFTLDSSNGRMMVIDADDMTVSGSWF